MDPDIPLQVGTDVFVFVVLQSAAVWQHLPCKYYNVDYTAWAAVTST